MDHRNLKKKPWLVQRVLRKDSEEKGIDGAFGFDYMGSAEFEFGSLFHALKAMRATWDQYLPEPKRIKDENGRIVWYVGPDDAEILAFAEWFFVDQSYGHCEHDLKERTDMRRAYEDEPDRWAPTGWWAIDHDTPWLLFVKKDDAREWIKRTKEQE